MRRRFLNTIIIAVLTLASSAVYAAPVQWSGNGHFYEVVLSSASWEDAKIAAASAGSFSHLATITSAGEQNFIASLVAPYNTPNVTGFKLGGFQPANSSEPGGGWQWVTGETWSYTNWGNGEPNNAGGEGYLYLDERYGWGWNDYVNTDSYYNPKGYIVEYDSNPVPEPGTMMLFGIGLGGLAIYGKRRKSYKA